MIRQELVRITPVTSPVTPAGNLVLDRDGALYFTRIVPLRPPDFYRDWLQRAKAAALAGIPVNPKLRALAIAMAGDITASGLYYTTHRDVWDTTQLAVDLDLETHKNALYDSTETPNFSTETAYSATNEVTGTNWAAGGVALTGTAVSESPAGTMMFDATDVSVANATFIGAEGAKLYADALAGNNLILCHDFAATASPTAATFTITYAAGGLFNIDLTP